MFLFFVELYVAVPLAIAYYPQFGKIKASDVEPEYQNLKNQQGEAIKEFQYNKGLWNLKKIVLSTQNYL